MNQDYLRVCRMTMVAMLSYLSWSRIMLHFLQVCGSSSCSVWILRPINSINSCMYHNSRPSSVVWCYMHSETMMTAVTYFGHYESRICRVFPDHNLIKVGNNLHD